MSIHYHLYAIIQYIKHIIFLWVCMCNKGNIYARIINIQFLYNSLGRKWGQGRLHRRFHIYIKVKKKKSKANLWTCYAITLKL